MTKQISHYPISLFFEIHLIFHASSTDLSSGKLIVTQFFVLGADSPLAQYLVELFKTDCIVLLIVFKEFLPWVLRDELSFHGEESVQRLNIFRNMTFRKVVLIRLDTKMFINLGLPMCEKSSNFFDSSVFHEEIRILQLSTMIGIISHQILCQEDAWIESSLYRLIDFALLGVD